MRWLLLLLLRTFLAICFAPESNYGQEFSPPAINIAQGKKIEGTSTCGVDVSERELFCKLATVPGKLALEGLSCDFCDVNTPSKNHPIEYAIDGSERWWQSPPLSRGLQYQEVNITIDLGQEYQVAYVIIKTGNAPRPGTWALEKSVDGGNTFTPWQYFATTNSECLNYFGTSSLLQSFKDDTTVTCTTSYSQVPPFEDGEIHISLVNGRPGAANFSYSQALQEWTRATHIRLRLLKVKTLLADLLPLARQDPTVTRRYFYSIKDISVGGICMCNGHADACVQLSQDDNSQFVCRCKHMTCGIKCQECCPGFVQKKWKPATPENNNECERCNCHNHATDCYYDERTDQEKKSLDINGNYEGGGVCVNCRHNTAGINCEKCKPGYYQPTGVPKTSPDVCQACSCDRRFSTGRCYDGDGRCECLENYSGAECDQCNEGFYGFPNCKPCDCHPMGTSGRVCGPTGDQCPCNAGYTGAKCDQCASGYYGFPNCTRCSCDNVGSFSPNTCDVNTGQCMCRQMYTSRQCNQCSKGFYSFPECKVCNCDAEGTARDICDPNTGACICMNNFAGPRCEVCNEGYFRFPICDECGCSAQGSVSPNCSQDGVCSCRDNYDGLKCDRCSVGHYSYPRCVKCACDPRGSQHQFCEVTTGQCFCKGSFRGINCNLCRRGYYGFPDCQQCQCNPAGIKPLPDGSLGDCSLSNEGQCDCRDNVQGLECTECKDGYYNLQRSNPSGCDSCDCNLDGVIGGLKICDKVTGQCPCKLYVTGRRCTSCKAGFYGLAGTKVFGCTGCGCDVGGAYNQYCDTTSGQCSCRQNVTGRDCSSPAPQHYYPTLLHIKAELEDGSTAPTKRGSDVLSPDEPFSSDGSPARFGFDENVFPGYSWRGYASMSDLQRALKITMDIPKTGRYHIVFRYVLNGSSPVTGEVMFMPKGGAGSKQSSKVTFPVSQDPAHQTVGAAADMATQFMLTKGKWDLMLLLPPTKILLDYVVALPQEYYEAYQLEEKVTKPCQVNGADSLCNQFSYLSQRRPGLFTTELETGYIIRRGGRLEDTQLFKNESVQAQLDFNAMALLDNNQNRVTADFSIPKQGKYVLVLQYFHPSDEKALVNVYLRYKSGLQRGDFNLQTCNYRFGCRQVAVNQNSGAVQVFDVKQLQRMVVTLLSRSSSPVAVDSITAIPLEMWTLDFIAPNILCTTQGGVCIPTSYPIPKGAVKIEADGNGPDEQQPPKQDPFTKLQYLKGPKVHELSGSVPRPGKYAAIVHYYQPMHSSFDSQVSIKSDRALDGTVKFHYCPHTSGCRSVVRDLNAAPFFDIGRTSVALELSIPVNSSTWIDYILLVPEGAFSNELQEDAPVPLTQEFLDSCSKDHFAIKSSDPQFCKDSVFSLTASFNNGSFACDCNLKGSYDSNCQEFGGQCSCRPNVIGRTCSRCKTGYYGFPNCRKCRCIFCNEVTGACDCPANTVGPNCESCLQGTYGHDPILGCQQCGCERHSVIGGNIACDVKTGQCNCKPSHTGRQCNKCAKGYYSYPLCQKCEQCDPRGVDERVCDGDTGQCFCKPGVIGERCDSCAAGHFNLDENNPNGCTKCWCNGLSDTCFSGNKYWSKVKIMDDWTIENTPASVVKIGAANLSAAISSQRNEKDKPVYWVAPKAYLGKKVSSYGGKLTYTVRYEVPQGGGSPILTVEPDVIIEGGDGKVLQYKKKMEISPGKTSAVEAQFVEHLWEDGSGSNVSRHDFMSVLLNINSLKLRATYSTEVAEAFINGVVMNVAVDGPVVGAARAKSVELCECPARATGASCELCAKAFTRGADNSSCVPCNCFGHSSNCHDETGECFSCLHNTTGWNCEVCEPGFYGNATEGSAGDCSICECPLGTTSNSFATSCALNPLSELLCKCQEGYSGPTCASCADGFYGNPSQPGDYCQRCICSGNLDSSVNGSCDTLTGHCLKCTNAARGDQCEHCLNGYYGDAVVVKNCARCACSECGTITAVCNHTTGFCNCKPNVIGDSCDSCKPNTWNFDSCLGCEDCDCTPVSLSPSCDVKTGQCQCPEGVTGRRCDRCKAGYFNYSDAGCQPCNCGNGEQGAETLYGFCDINTGQCCKWGGNCTICPENYILTPEGCEYCGECVGRLLTTAINLDHNVTLALKSVQEGTAGIIAEGHFSDVNATLQRLIPPTNKYNATMEAVSQLVGISSTNGGSSDNVTQDSSLMQRTESFEKLTKEVDNKAMKAADDATNALTIATFTEDDALALEQEIKDALNRTQDIIDLAKKIANTLKTDKANQTLLLERAEEILKELTNRDFSSTNMTIIEEQELAMASLSQAKLLLNSTLSLWNDLSNANKTLDELMGTFGMIHDKTSDILENASLAMDTNNISRSYDSESPLTEAIKRKEEVDIALMSLQDVVKSASGELMNASGSFQAFNGSFPQLDDLIDQVNKRVANLSQTLDDLTPSVVMAQNHSEELRKQADELEKLLTDIEFARKAVNASQRYSDIVSALNESLLIAREAERIAMDAKDKSLNISDQAKNSQNRSSILNETASITEAKVDGEVKSLLDDLKKRLERIRDKIRRVSGDLADVESNFPGFDDIASRIGGKASEFESNATASKNRADDAQKKAEEIEAQLTGLSGLNESVIATNNNITELENQVRDAINMSKTIKDKVVIQERRHEQIVKELDTEVKRHLDDIGKMLARANTLLRYTSLNMKFDGETTSKPVLPAALQKDTRSFATLMYIKPAEPNGLIMFMGDVGNSGSNRQKRQSQQADYAALELKATTPILKMCTKGICNTFEASKNISTNGKVWYKVDFDVSGNEVSLSMKNYVANKGEETAVSIEEYLRMDNPKMTFNEDSVLLLGGTPMTVRLPPEVSTVNYTGCIDGLQVNHHFIGTWNSELSWPLTLAKPVEDSYCLSRTGEAQFAPPQDKESRTFFGTGYLKSGRYDLDPMIEMDFKFKTSSSNGILAIEIDDYNPSLFQAMELSDGYLLFSYNMGCGFKSVRSKKLYDTGEEVLVQKRAPNGVSYTLTITDTSDRSVEEIAKNRMYCDAGRPEYLTAEYVYWGGIENRSRIPENVTQKFFKGCLSGMTLYSGDISVQPSPGYIFGCHLKPAWNVTFLSDSSFLVKEAVFNRRTRTFDIGLSFQVPPSTRHGLFLSEFHQREKEFIVLGVVEGKVTFQVNPGSVPLTLQTEKQYNDGKWHFVTVRKDGFTLKLYVDDEVKTGVLQDKAQQVIQTTQDMYLGGIPKDVTFMTNDFNSVILNSLKGGSIRDLTFDDVLFDFMEYKDRNAVIFDGEDYSEPTPKDPFIEITPTQPPIGQLDSTTSKEFSSTSIQTTASPSTPEESTTPIPTTTTPEPVPTPTPTTPAPVCSMPETPAQLSGVMGFGHDLNSHAAYEIKGPLLKLIGSKTKLSFEFRASNPNGIMLYTANANQADFIECHLQDGKVSCSFSAGGGILQLFSAQASYSDGSWHTVRLSRKGVNGTLYVDDSRVDSGRAKGTPSFVNALQWLHIGGVPEGYNNKRVPAGSRVSFPGCIRNVTVNKVDIGSPTTPYKMQPCYQNSPEAGVSFEHGGGYLKVGESYTVGQTEDISLEIKPTSHTGLLLSSSNKKGDYIVLEMIRGDIIFRAENGGGELVVTYSAEDPLEFCDGKWHKIQAWKESNIVRLQVDDGPVLEGGGKGSQTSADIFNDLYAGGLPAGVEGKGVTATKEYTGCMRNLVSKNPGGSAKPVSLVNPLMMGGNVYLGGCPYYTS